MVGNKTAIEILNDEIKSRNFELETYNLRENKKGLEYRILEINKEIEDINFTINCLKFVDKSLLKIVT